MNQNFNIDFAFEKHIFQKVPFKVIPFLEPKSDRKKYELESCGTRQGLPIRAFSM
jgi:hypothetical protein